MHWMLQTGGLEIHSGSPHLGPRRSTAAVMGRGANAGQTPTTLVTLKEELF